MNKDKALLKELTKSAAAAAKTNAPNAHNYKAAAAGQKFVVESLKGKGNG